MDLNEINFNESGEWPLIAKSTAIIVLCLLTWGAGYYFIIKDKQAALSTVENKEVELKKDFETKQKKASTLEAYKAQMVEMETSFTVMLKQLPRKSEVADLLVDISHTGLRNGLEFESFKPGGEEPVDFYGELSISMEVVGTYHQLGKFISSVVTLPRIVTIHDMKVSPIKGTDKMRMELTAKTYRYFDQKTN